MKKKESVEQILDHCKKLIAADQRAGDHDGTDSDAIAMARFIVDALGVPFPCGFAEPCIVPTPDGTIVMIDGIEFGTRNETLGIAAAIVRCALELPEDE